MPFSYTARKEVPTGKIKFVGRPKHFCGITIILMIQVQEFELASGNKWVPIGEPKFVESTIQDTANLLNVTFVKDE